MSDSEKNSAKKSGKKPPQNAMRDWIIRGVVFGTLGILLIVALLDFQAKQAATKTSAAWRAAMSSVDEHKDLTKSQFDQVLIQGKPVVTTEKAGPNAFAAVSVNTYVWNGTFRTYTVKVYFGMGKDATVEEIQGPGEPGQ